MFSSDRTLESRVETALSGNDFIQLKACFVTTNAKPKEITQCAQGYMAKHPTEKKAVSGLMQNLFTWKGEYVNFSEALQAIIREVFEADESESTEKQILSFFQGGGTINQLASFLSEFCKTPTNREGDMALKVQKALQLQLQFLTDMKTKTKGSEVFSKVLFTNYSQDFAKSVQQLVEVSKACGFTECALSYQKLIT
jgi:hypothetical protein